jgi:serine protease
MKIRAGLLRVLMLLVIVSCLLGCGGDSQSNEVRKGTSPPPPSSFNVSGTITASANFVADSDVNDPAAVYIPNDTFAQAQTLPNPVVVGGYVNVQHTGPQGRSFANGDPSDFFSVDLASGQVITLYVSESAGVELDLALYDAGQALVDESLGPAAVESVSAPADGTYFVEVRAVANASMYNLTVGQPAPAAAKYALRLSDEFVPGQVIVHYQAAPGGYGPAQSTAAIGLKSVAGAAEREMLLDIGDDVAQQQTVRTLGIPEARLNLRAADPAMQRKLQTLQIISALRKQANIASADPNYIWRPSAAANDPLYPLQWNYPLINLPQAWDVTTGSNGVIVAVIDTGVLLNHPDLQGRLIAGYDFISDPARADDGDGIDPNPDDPGDQALGGSSFHGTHVTGTIAADMDNTLGVAGVTQASQVMPLRALGIGGGTEYDVLQAVRYAAGLANDSGTLPAQKADVINLSLGGGGFSQTAQDVFSAARVQGLIVVAAAGNESTTVPTYPAAYDGVVSVSAVDINGNLAWYSNTGPTIDVAAPGGNTRTDVNGDGFPDGVLSTCGDDSSGSIRYTYCFFQGTSMASPHVAGVAALMKAVYPILTPDEFDQLLINGLLTDAAGRSDQFGYGQIDAFRAVAAAQDLAGGAPLPPTIIVDPAFLNLAASGTVPQSTELEIRNGTQAPLTISSVISDPAAAWLSVTEKTVDAEKLGVYTVTVDPGSLPPGVYAADITVSAVDPTVLPATVPVRMQVFSPLSGGNVGFIYVLLVDPDTLMTVAEADVPYDAATAHYSYNFSGVPAGTYRIYAGTDADNDSFIGDPGEAIGAYRTVDQPTSVEIPGANTELDFEVGYEVALPSRLSTQATSRNSVLQRLVAPGRSMR